MIFYDLIHGYQPFHSQKFIPKWIKKNLQQIFLPTSIAMKKGLILRGIQIQAWTIETWLNAEKSIKNLGQKTLNNLQIANKKKNIEIGISAYSHPILPMLSNDLIKAQILLDKEIVEKYIGKPTWFWPPEGAIDQRVLKVIHEVFPDLILLIPDKAIGEYNFNEPIKIKFSAKGAVSASGARSASGGNNGLQKVIVFNTLLKSLFMNAEDYKKRPKYIKRPKYLPKDLVWAKIRRTVHSPKIFLDVLNYLDKDKFVLMRDWENAGSKKGLRKIDSCKEIGNFLKLKTQIDFHLPSQFDWEEVKIVPINKIKPCSWDMESKPSDPFPWWQPNKHGRVWKKHKALRRKKIIEWQEMIKEFDKIFQQKVKKYNGIEAMFKNKQLKNLLKQTLPVLHSCIGWHYFAKRSWKPDYQYSQAALKNIVLPGLEKLKKL